MDLIDVVGRGQPIDRARIAAKIERMLKQAPNLDPYRKAYYEQLLHQVQCEDDLSLRCSTDFFGRLQPRWGYCLECLREGRQVGERDLRQHYAYALPSEDALRTIAERSPNGVVEIGAGGGYWAMLLRNMGVDIVAFDPNPVGHGENPYVKGEAWSDVSVGPHTVVQDYPDRTLLMVWPECGGAWSHEAVELYEGSTVIYVGEDSGGCTGDDKMFQLLGLHDSCGCWEDCDCPPVTPKFSLVGNGEVWIPQWWGLRDRMYVCAREGAGAAPRELVGAAAKS